MFLKNEDVKVAPYFVKSIKDMNFLGFVPFANIDYRVEYYTVPLCENIKIGNSVIDHVSPIFEGFPDIWSDQEISASSHLEQHYINEKLSKNEKQKTKKLTPEEIIKYENILKNRIDKPFVLFFVGGDDQSSFLRFTNKDEATEYLELADCFEDLFKTSDIQYY